jgi:phosphate transport system permease protein
MTTTSQSVFRPAGETAGGSATPPRTFLPNPDAEIDVVAGRRRPGAMTLADRLNLYGAGLAAVSVTALLFGRLSPMSGVVAGAAVALAVFVLVYALLVRMASDRQAVKNQVVTVLLGCAGTVLIATLAFIILFTFDRGISALIHPNFFSQDMSVTGPLSPLNIGGVWHAILGTLIQIGIALAITVPLGLSCAVYLNEVHGRFARFVRTVVEAMTALPSIVAGLFIYAALIVGLKQGQSGFAAALAITVMMLPIVIRAADVVLRLVPGNLREASYALGASHWRTVWQVVLPTARSGLATAVILGTARGIGETSPVLLTAGISSARNLNPFSGPMISLPLQVFELVKSPEPAQIARGFGAAAALLFLVLVLFVIARVIGGRAAGELSARGRRSAARASNADAARFAARRPPSALPAPSPESWAG